MAKIGILLGDDIGLDVVPECAKVMSAAAAKTRLAVEWKPLQFLAGRWVNFPIFDVWPGA